MRPPPAWSTISRDTLEIQSDGLDQALTLRGNITEKTANSHPSKHRPGGYRRARRRQMSSRKKIRLAAWLDKVFVVLRM